MDLTAKSSPDGLAVASETVAVEPRPKVGPLFHSMGERERDEDLQRGSFEYGFVGVFFAKGYV